MSTVRAQILIGREHPWGGGIWPTHVMYLTENSKPAWVLVGSGVSNEVESDRVVWIPSIDHMLEDGLALVAARVLDAPTVRSALGSGADINDEPLFLLERFSVEELTLVRQETCKVEPAGAKLILTVLEESSLRSQLDVLEHYPFDHVVCLPNGNTLPAT